MRPDLVHQTELWFPRAR